MHDEAESPSGRAATVGDITICFDCTGVAQFDGSMMLAKIPPDEWAALPEAVRDDYHRTRALLLLMKSGRWGGQA